MVEYFGDQSPPLIEDSQTRIKRLCTCNWASRKSRVVAYADFGIPRSKGRLAFLAVEETLQPSNPSRITPKMFRYYLSFSKTKNKRKTSGWEIEIAEELGSGHPDPNLFDCPPEILALIPEGQPDAKWIDDYIAGCRSRAESKKAQDEAERLRKGILKEEKAERRGAAKEQAQKRAEALSLALEGRHGAGLFAW